MRRVVAIVGSREFADPEEMEQSILRYVEGLAIMVGLGADIEIISGGARGADTFAEKAAKHFGIPFTPFLADWFTHGRKAGFVRNAQMAIACTECVAFRAAGKSNGTDHMVEQVRKLGRPVTIMHEDGRVERIEFRKVEA